MTYTFLIKIIWIFYIDNIPISDFAKMLETTIIYNNGNTNIYNEDSYFIFWNYQIPFSLYEAFLLKIFKEEKILEIFNCLWLSLSIIPGFLILKEIYNEKIAKLLSLFFVLYTPYYYYCSILTNQILSLFLVLCAIYFFLMKKNILADLFLGLSQLFRPIALIILIAFALEKILILLKKKEKNIL